MNLQMRILRKKSGLTQEELAERLGSTPRKVGAWERCESSLPIDEAARIADILDCSLDELVGRTWNRRINFSDPRQEELNRSFEALDQERRDRLVSTAHDMEAASGRGAAAVPPERPAV